jgi:hydrogenase maturation protein HypF
VNHNPPSERREVVVHGIVQGVGFRPFIYSLAQRRGLTGLVRNDTAGVHIEAEGLPSVLDDFLRAITEQLPPLAVIETLSWRSLDTRGDRDFRIDVSREGNHRRALISPDMATCDACLAELLDPGNRRYRYPFINCTNCGPRFTIIRSVPYDRPATTMAGFTMCPDCRHEYEDPINRRFHAQPNACPVCGPRVELLDVDQHPLLASHGDPLRETAALLRAGSIIAIKGLGGYHLACDPFNDAAVETLRNRKVRQDKPFALMARDLEQARTLCRVEAEEEALLTSPARPIVLLDRREDCGIAEAVAPGQKTIGMMLAYTPLHHVLLHDIGSPLVMTSGNRSDEPIAFQDADAFAQLRNIADAFLVHNRPIHMRCDDSVLRVVAGQADSDRGHAYPIRRARGYAPAPLNVAQPFRHHILACGGELKNTFCLAKESHAFLSPHIGDLENYETFTSFRNGIDHYRQLFDIQPALVAHDLHPEYLSTKYALELAERGLPAVAVQHHHAHIASCLADNQRPVEERVIGVAMDGTGYGSDGTIWGGEFLEGSVREGFTRRAHLEYAPLPGGEAAIRQPWRSAIAQLLAVYSLEEVLALPLGIIQRAGERNVRLIASLIRAGTETRTYYSPLTSSAGRLFDAVAALIDVPSAMRTTYEGQAAIELELAAAGAANCGYSFQLREQSDTWVVETAEILTGVVEDMTAGIAISDVSSRFHRTMAEVVLAGCDRIRETGGAAAVALSGGTFQNMLLLRQVVELLQGSGYVVYLHRRVPANDGGLALGQAVLAAFQEGTS